MVKWELNHHRTTIVRTHARHNLLAYGLLRGVLYGYMECRCNEPPNFDSVIKVAKNFGGNEEDIAAWVQKAKEYLKAYKK